MKRFILTFFFILFFSITLLEFIFRFIIIAPQYPEREFNSSEKIYFYKPNQSGFYTRGRLSEYKCHWKINNSGWNSDIDYNNKNCIALIGDSYIESLFLPCDKRLPSLLSSIDNKYCYQSFGISGNSFSQYLNIYKYVNKVFNPGIVIFNIVEFDISESIENIVYMPRNMQLNFKGDSIIERQPLYFDNNLRRILKKSALFRYLYSNFHFKLYFGKSKKIIQSELSITQKEILFQKSVDYLVQEILKIDKNKTIIFILDADRNAIYDNKKIENPRLKYFKKYLSYDRIKIIDNHENFQKFYKRDFQKFEFAKNDIHWNSYGYKCVAEAIYSKIEEIDNIRK
jgi:hypothetical protein